MDILLDQGGDLYLSSQGDIILGDSVAQKIRIRLLWFEGEWKWDREKGIPYPAYLLKKNPDLDFVESVIRSRIFEVAEVTEVREVRVVCDSRTRSARIQYTALTDMETIREEVDIKCLIME